MAEGYSYKSGRIWVQEKKFEPFMLLLPYGMTSITDPTGSLNPVREPHPGQRGASVVVDVLRGEPGLPTFTIETRLFRTLNYMMKYRNRRVNFQCHLGQCGRADNYRASEVGLHWEQCQRGDLDLDRTSIVQGDDSPIAVGTQFSAEQGPNLIDFHTEFGSRIQLAEGQAITDIAMITDACDDITDQTEPGDVGYLATKAGASVYADADVWWTQDAWETPQQVPANPFDSGEDISSVVVMGTKEDHRVVVSRGTSDGANPAEVAVADVTEPGTVSWSNYDVGSVNGEYITYLAWPDYGHMYAITNLGRIYRSKDGGATWTLVRSTGNQLNDVQALLNGTVWVATTNDTVWLSEDFGDTWTSIAGPLGGTGAAVTSVAVTPDGTVFIGKDDGNIYGSYDQGDNWTTLALQGATAVNVDRIRAADDSVIWAVGTLNDGSSRVFRSTDGGASFLLWNLNLPTNSGLNALAVVDINKVIVGGEAHDGQGFLAKTRSKILG